MTDLPGEAAARRAESAAAGASGETGETPGDRAARKRSDRTRRISSVLGAVASAALGSCLGYLAWPVLTATHPSTLQAFELAGALIGGLLFVSLLLFAIPAAPTKPATGQEEIAEEGKGNKEEAEKEPTEAPYDFRSDQRLRHRALIWAVPVTLALAAVSYILIDLSYPGVAASQRTTPLDRLGFGIGGFLALLTVGLVGGCVYAAWPARVYGPKKAPHPWVLPLKLTGYWLAITPFSLFSLGAIGLGIYQGLDGAWGAMIFLLIFGLLCGAGCSFLLAGSGALRGEELEEGEEVSARLRRSAWWGHFKIMLTIWALAITVMALVYLFQADWSDFADVAGGACVSWFARYQAGAGKMPKSVFHA